MAEETVRTVRATNSPLSDRLSIYLGFLAMAGLIIWMIVTYTRGGIDGGVLPDPQWWFTGVIPVGLALIWLGLQVVFLGDSAVTATHREVMGINDMMVSIFTFGTVAVIIVVVGLLWWLKKMSISMNHVSGLGFWLFATFCEMLATIRVWMVANRRPGGVIAGPN